MASNNPSNFVRLLTNNFEPQFVEMMSQHMADATAEAQARRQVLVVVGDGENDGDIGEVTMNKQVRSQVQYSTGIK